jgi:hypothetical protein
MKQKKKNSNKQPPKARKPSRKRIGPLRNAKDVARYMSRSIKRAERREGGDDPNIYYKLVTMASMLLKAIEVSTFEDRIARIEKEIDKRTEKQNELGGPAFEDRGSPGNRNASDDRGDL